MRLADLVTIEHNDMNSVVLKVKENSEMDLICLGYFSGDETMFRLTKGDNHTCTVWGKDGKHFSWYWGSDGYELVSDETKQKGRMIQDCIVDDFGIVIKGDIESTLYQVVPSEFDDEFKLMYFADDYMVHKNGNVWKAFTSISEFKRYLIDLGYDRPVKKDEYKAKTGCNVEIYRAHKNRTVAKVIDKVREYNDLLLKADYIFYDDIRCALEEKNGEENVASILDDAQTMEAYFTIDENVIKAYL